MLGGIAGDENLPPLGVTAGVVAGVPGIVWPEMLGGIAGCELNRLPREVSGTCAAEFPRVFDAGGVTAPGGVEGRAVSETAAGNRLLCGWSGVFAAARLAKREFSGWL